MKPKFRQIFEKNEIDEIGNDLMVATQAKIRKYRKLEKELPEDAESDAYISAIEQLAQLDSEITEAINNEFEITTEKMEELKKRALLVGLKADATEAEIISAEKQKADEAKAAEKAKEKEAEEKAKKETEAKKKKETDDAAAKKQKEETEAAEAKAKSEAEENEKIHKLPGNERALAKLHKAGKTEVTEKELKEAGFNTGFFGPISENGCTIGNFRLYREDQYQTKFTLSKIK